MKDHKWQHIRLRVSSPGQVIRFNVDADKAYKRVKGIRVIFPEDKAATGACLGLNCNQKEIFDDSHEVRMITCGQNVPPNTRFFLFDEEVDAAGTSIQGRFTDGALNPYLTANGQDATGVIDPLSVNMARGTGGSGSGSGSGTTQPANPFSVTYPYDVQIQLWLTNDALINPAALPHKQH